MKKIYIYVLVLFVFVSCNKTPDCSSKIIKYHISDEYTISSSEFFNGFSIDSKNKRFQLNCLLDSKGNDIMHMFDIDSLQTNYSFKLQEQYSRNFSNNDSLFLFFWDKRKYIRSYAANNLMLVKINDLIEPCDSIKQIIYSNVSEKIEKLAKDNVELVDLFDKVLEDRICEYLKSLSPVQKEELRGCRKTFKLLDWIENSKEYGFPTKEYKLTSGIKDFLNIIIQVVSEKNNSEQWQYRKFVISIVGYADERTFGNSKKISRNRYGFDLNKEYAPLVAKNCSDKKFVTLNESHLFVKTLETIKNNCELSWMRAFATALFLEQEFEKKDLKNIVKIRYCGGDISYGRNYDLNRKIELRIELMAGAK